MFEKFKKITDWDFLSQNTDIKTIWLEVADDVKFIRRLPKLVYFKCLKIINKDLSPVEELGFSKLPHRASVFYSPIDS